MDNNQEKTTNKSIGVKVISFVFAICVFLIVLYVSLVFWTFNVSFYEYEFNKNDTATKIGIDNNELNEALYELFDFIKFDTDELDYVATSYKNGVNPFYTEREYLHMLDVREMFKTGKHMFYGALVTSIVILVSFRKNLNVLMNLFRKYLIIINALFLVTIAIVSTNFNKYFIMFHELTFNNDYWILNSNEDMLINMVELQFFIDICIAISVTYVLCTVVLILITKKFDEKVGE